MTAITDSQIFSNVFSTPEISAIWSDRQRTQYFLDFEAALARAQASLGIIPQKACDEIVRHCSLEYLDFDLLRKQTELIGYPVLPVVQQLVAKVNAVEKKLGEWAHWGATTQVCLIRDYSRQLLPMRVGLLIQDRISPTQPSCFNSATRSF
jgi:3-carboxy-cis,cis-muconate cycloisomerase